METGKLLYKGAWKLANQISAVGHGYWMRTFAKEPIRYCLSLNPEGWQLPAQLYGLPFYASVKVTARNTHTKKSVKIAYLKPKYGVISRFMISLTAVQNVCCFFWSLKCFYFVKRQYIYSWFRCFLQ